MHEVSSPYHPQSNGLAEAAVKSVKALLSKTKEMGEDFYEALAAWKCVPHATGDDSPASLFFKRRLRTPIPALSAPDASGEPGGRQQEDGNAKGRRLTRFDVGDRVRVQHPATRRWDSKATIIKVSSNGRSYTVDFDNGKRTRRNRRYLRELK